eukprot:15365069-Ditylum_brightwellii.AAC.1
MFLIFTEAGKAIKLETFPKKAPKIKAFLDYEYYMTKTIFKNSKDTIVNIGHETKLNPFCIN